MALLEAALIDACKATIARGGGDIIRLQPDSDGYERICLGAVELNWEFTYKLCQHTRFGLEMPAKALLVNAIDKIDKATQSRMSAGLSGQCKKKAYYAFEVEKMRQLVFYCKRLCRRQPINTSRKNKKSNDLKKLYTEQRQAARGERAKANSAPGHSVPVKLVDLTSDSGNADNEDNAFPPPPEPDDDAGCHYIEDDHLLPSNSCLVVTSFDKLIVINDGASDLECDDGCDKDDGEGDLDCDDGCDEDDGEGDLDCFFLEDDEVTVVEAAPKFQAPAPGALLAAEAKAPMLNHALQRKDPEKKKQKKKGAGAKKKPKAKGAKKRKPARRQEGEEGPAGAEGAKAKKAKAAIPRPRKACGAEEATPKKKDGEGCERVRGGDGNSHKGSAGRRRQLPQVGLPT